MLATQTPECSNPQAGLPHAWLTEAATSAPLGLQYYFTITELVLVHCDACTCMYFIGADVSPAAVGTSTSAY